MGQEIATLSAQAVHTHSAHTETAETCTTCICIYTHFIYNVIHIVCGSEEAEDTCTNTHLYNATNILLVRKLIQRLYFSLDHFFHNKKLQFS